MNRAKSTFVAVIMAAIVMAIGSSAFAFAVASPTAPAEKATMTTSETNTVTDATEANEANEAPEANEANETETAKSDEADDGINHEFEGEEIGENGDGVPEPNEATETK